MGKAEADLFFLRVRVEVAWGFRADLVKWYPENCGGVARDSRYLRDTAGTGHRKYWAFVTGGSIVAGGIACARETDAAYSFADSNAPNPTQHQQSPLNQYRPCELHDVSSCTPEL